LRKMTDSDHDRVVKNERDISIVARDVSSLDHQVRAFAPSGAQIAGVQGDVDELRRDVQGLRADIQGLRFDMNGRLRRLEVWRATVDTLQGLFRWGITATVGIVCTVVSGLAVYLLTH
jgi:hypothetical protein